MPACVQRAQAGMLVNARGGLFGMLGGTVGADAIQQHGVAFQRETSILGNLVLPLFDFVISKFDDLAAIGADEVIVMISVVEFEHSLAAVELTANKYAGLLELGEHPVNGGQTYIDVFCNQCPVNVLSALVAEVGPPKNIKNLEARERRLQAHIF
jgi:hypothetical protein